MSTTIEWTDETWNPVTGCTKVSPGVGHLDGVHVRVGKKLAGAELDGREWREFPA